jgi:hypothetical protein
MQTTRQMDPQDDMNTYDCSVKGIPHGMRLR